MHEISIPGSPMACVLAAECEFMENNHLVERFCTPPLLPKTDDDRKAIIGSEIHEFPSEGHILKGYSWGTGKNVLLVHV